MELNTLVKSKWKELFYISVNYNISIFSNSAGRQLAASWCVKSLLYLYLVRILQANSVRQPAQWTEAGERRRIRW